MTTHMAPLDHPVGGRWFAPLAILAAVMFITSPLVIANAPYEATMGMVQKIFYFHVPSAMMMLLASIVCGVASAVFLFKGSRTADMIAVSAAELGALFGCAVLVSGPLWARKSWGVWWQWDARLTTSLLLFLIFCGYLLVRRYGGPGSDRFAAAVGLFGMLDAPIIYKSVDIWRTIHPKTTVLWTLGPGMREAFWFCLVAFLLLFVLLLTLRFELERRRADLDALWQAVED
jgi:heme exporter protein C